jgi:hypothetical protein
MQKIYICAPLRGCVVENLRVATIWSRKAYKAGYFPICVHIFLEKATGLREFNDRPKLLELGIEALKMCDECWVCTPNISEGMKGEIAAAKKNKIKVRYVWKEGKLK